MFDIDDTLLVAHDIYIKKILNGNISYLTSYQFARDNKNSLSQYLFDEYNHPEKVANSIIRGLPIHDNLKLLAKNHDLGYDIGILTARGLEDTIHESVNTFLQKNLGTKYTINRDLVFAIGDTKYNFNSTISNNTSSLKLSILQKLSNEYEEVIFVDDDIKNINAVNLSKIKNITCIHYYQ
jgi:hypothetical protein